MGLAYKNGRYTIDVYPQGRKGPRIKRRLPQGTTEQEAKELLTRYISAKNNLSSVQSSSGNISRLAPKYISHCYLHQSHSTSYDKESVLKTHIIPFFGSLHVQNITTQHITQFKEFMKQRTFRDKPITNRTINKAINILSGFLRWAEEDRQLTPLSPVRIRRLPSTRPVPIVLSIEEAMAFINSANKLCKHAHQCPKNPKCPHKIAYNVMFKIFFYLGLRNRAVRRMRWEDVDWTKHAIKTVEKGSKVKWHPIPDDLHDDLRGLYINSSSDWIFPSPKDRGKPVNNILKGVSRAKAKAGITKRVYPHLLRHSIATHLVDLDVDIRQIQNFLDHAQISTTQFYTQVSIEKKRQAMEKAGFKTTKM